VGTQLTQLSYVRQPCVYWDKARNFSEARKLLPSDVIQATTESQFPTSYWCTPVALADATQLITALKGTPGVLTVTAPLQQIHTEEKVIKVIGNLTREPEIRYTREGQATTTLGVAVNRRWQDRSTKQWEESTSFFDVVCWRELAENAALSLVKGMRVVVTGRLEHRSWETEEGEHRSKVEVVADDLGPSLRFATAEVQRTERRGAESEESGRGGVARRVQPKELPSLRVHRFRVRK
jgi:single-strand DNA-binding protein